MPKEITPIIGSDYPLLVVPLIDSAKNSICILMYDWRWVINHSGSSVQSFNQSIVRAVARGVSVRCLVENAYALQPLLEIGAVCKKVLSKNMLHSKLILIDDHVVVLGSHNISWHAFSTNFETSVAIDNLEIFAVFRKYFDNLWL